MIDRASTKVLDNGAIRYAVYDEFGNFLRYEYMLLADEPTQEGTPINKATLFSDAVAALYSLGVDAVPGDALAAIKTILDSKAKIATGSYSGNGSASRQINVSFKPSFVIVIKYSMLSIKFQGKSWITSFSMSMTNTTHGANSSGFLVGTGDDPGGSGYSTNVSGDVYDYFAIG